MPSFSEPLSFIRGPAMPNRFMLAPLTNSQSFEDGRLSDQELNWLVMRARGGFGLTMTCAAHVSESGKGFPGQLGIFADTHLDGLTRLADAIRAEGSLSSVQLYHGGMRSPREVTGRTPMCPSANEEFGGREMTTGEIEQTVQDFVDAAARADQAGFDGVEIHGAHGYLICQFLSGEVNQRSDDYGGTLENRARLLFEIVAGIRARCRPDFQLGVRLSPERFGMDLVEVQQVAQRLMSDARVDYLDMSLWDVFKEPADERFKGRSLLSYFTELDRGQVRLGAAGKVAGAAAARDCLNAGADFVLLGRAAMLHHDFPARAAARADFEPVALPVSRAYLHSEGLSDAFIAYMERWPGFVEDSVAKGA